MGDLISRKALLQKLEGKNSYSVNTATTEQIMKSYAYADCICIIEHEPTAYDVDKVVEQLQKSNHNYYPSIDSYCVSEKAVKLKDAIEIVKGGGQE